MFPERKKISVKDLNVGDMVIGQHVDNKSYWQYKTVAGKITSRRTKKDGIVTYDVKGKTFPRHFGKPAELSGILDENEVEVTDPNICITIIELLEAANEQLNKGLQNIGLDTASKAHEMRHKSRAELEEKYAVVEA